VRIILRANIGGSIRISGCGFREPLEFDIGVRGIPADIQLQRRLGRGPW